MTLSTYNFLWGILKVFLASYLVRRQRKGKEDKYRLNERYGISKKLRPDGISVWLHGASVGESVAALALANSKKKNGFGKNKNEFFLLTTNTTSAAKLIKDKIKNVTAIGLVKNRNQFPSKITKDCLKVPSTKSPKIKPIITGTTEKP